jgi:molecular chaperone DnaK (HSP70)
MELAVDLGTSNTVAMVRSAGGPIRPLLFDGREQLSSAVYADPGGALIAGHDADRLAGADPAAFEPNPKRRIDDGTILLGERSVEVADALAAVLSNVVAQLGPTRKPEQTVLTVPSGWGAARRAVLATAAERAGLGPVTLVSEPIAAAAFYTSGLGRELPPDAALLVVDVGAGTADAALVRNSTVVAQRGLDVGGLDVDAALVDLLAPLVSRDAPELWQRLAHPATGADRRDRLALWQEVRAAKESLSRLSVAPVHVPGCGADLHLTREEVETAATKLLSAVVDVAADLAPPDLSAVLLVGGGSRMPLLGRLLHTRLGVAPDVVERPEMAVVEGALHTVAPAHPTATPAAPEHQPIRRRWLPETWSRCGDGAGRRRVEQDGGHPPVGVFAVGDVELEACSWR